MSENSGFHKYNVCRNIREEFANVYALFALVEDDTYLDPVENLITITEKNIVQQKLSRKRHQSNLDNFVEQI
jgi:hypothetical protein